MPQPDPAALGWELTEVDHDHVGGGGTPLLLLHGFTQSRRGWGPFLDLLVAGRPVVTVDLPGHGESRSVQADLITTADLIDQAAWSALPEVAQVDVLGYSLGARAALHLALAHPGRVRALVVVSGTPGIQDPVMRQERRRRDEALADELERQGDLAGFLDRWLAAPMFATLPRGAAQRAARLDNTPSGLAASLRLAGTGAQDPLWDRLTGLDRPTLVVCGATDLRFTSIGQRMVSSLPRATLSVVPGAGHAVQLEQPETTGRLVAAWLGSIS